MQARIRYVVIIGFVAVVALAWFFWDSSERAIRAVLREGEAAVEAKDLAAAMSQISRQYLDENGLNYLAVRRALGWAFNRFQRIDVRIYDVSIDVNGDQATARAALQVLTADRSESKYLVGAAGLPERATIILAKERLAWKVVSLNGIEMSRLGF
jgi:ketosteroid isomerase-like protein